MPPTKLPLIDDPHGPCTIEVGMKASSSRRKYAGGSCVVIEVDDIGGGVAVPDRGGARPGAAPARRRRAGTAVCGGLRALGGEVATHPPSRPPSRARFAR